jgi:hypothetical protein
MASNRLALARAMPKPRDWLDLKKNAQLWFELPVSLCSTENPVNQSIENEKDTPNMHSDSRPYGGRINDLPR